MKEKFESILLQLKSNLKSDSVIDALKTDKDKELHQRLINVINRYYENINLFDNQKESLKKLLFENANNLLSNTNSSHFDLYLSNFRNYANFLVDNYYKNQNILINENNINILEVEESIKKIKNINLDELSKNAEKIRKVDLNVLQQNLDLLKDIDLKKLNEQIVNNGVTFDLDKLKNFDLDKFQKSLDEVKKLNLDSSQNDGKNIQNNINIIDEQEFEKRYMKLVSLLNSEDVESNLILYTKAEKKPFKLYKNSNNSIFIKAGLETKNMSLPLNKCISIIYKNEETPFKSYTEVLFPKIFDNTIFDEIKNDNFIIGDKNSIDEKDIIDSKPIIYNNPIPEFHSDVPSNNNIDCLNIGMDVNAFAKLIANKSLQPPLAIGLFGKWGSGKSFFMEEVEKKIEELRKEKNTEKIFCEEIVHIKFNAWHYSDSNLWANLMIQIFEGLNKFLKPQEVDKIENLYLQLDSTKEFLKEKEDEKIAIHNNASMLK